MTATNVLEALRNSHFFSGCSDEHLKHLTEICPLVAFQARTKMFEEYEPARDVYVIVNGEISLAICEPEESCKQIAVVQAGDLVVWSPLVGRTRVYNMARTQKPVL